MFCEQCGASNAETSSFCIKCGAKIANANKPNLSVPMSGVPMDTTANIPAKKQNNFLLVHARKIIVLIEMLMIALCIAVMSDLDNFTGLLITLGLCAIALLIGQINASSRYKKHSNYPCPKCKTETNHNKYGVCANCHLDFRSNQILTLLLMIVTMGLIIWGIGIDEFLFTLFTLAIVVLSILILFPIYMYPATMARRTEHSAAVAITALDFLFGWTFVMWLILLIWASSGNGNAKAVIAQPQQKSAQESMNELMKLRDMNMVTEDEFQAKRAEILTRL